MFCLVAGYTKERVRMNGSKADEKEDFHWKKCKISYVVARGFTESAPDEINELEVELLTLTFFILFQAFKLMMSELNMHLITPLFITVP